MRKQHRVGYLHPLQTSEKNVFRFVDEFDSNIIYDMPEPRLIGPNDPTPLEQSQER